MSQGVAAVVLAAGGSTRLGSAKQLVRLHGETLLDRAVRVAREAGCAPVVVVLGARAEEIQRVCSLDGTTVVLNTSWQEGMGSSVRVGIAALPSDTCAAVVLACDQPAVTAAHLRALVAREEDVVASCYAGRRGVPACFRAAIFADLLELRGDQGARALIQKATAIDLPDGELDIDTPETLAAVLQHFA